MGVPPLCPLCLCGNGSCSCTCSCGSLAVAVTPSLTPAVLTTNEEGRAPLFRCPARRVFPPAVRSYVRRTTTGPFVVTARIVGPPLPRSKLSLRLMRPCTVTGKSKRIGPFTVPVSRCAL